MMEGQMERTMMEALLMQITFEGSWWFEVRRVGVSWSWRSWRAGKCTRQTKRLNTTLIDTELYGLTFDPD